MSPFRYRILLVMIFLWVTTVAGSAASGTFSLDVRADSSASLLSGDIRATTERIVQEELDWVFHFSSDSDQRFTVAIESVSLDTTLFQDSVLVWIELSWTGPSESEEHTIAFLTDSLETWETRYEQRLRYFIRENSIYLVPDGEGPKISNVHDSGIWTTYDGWQVKRGSRVRILDRQGVSIALLEVADQFLHTSDGAETGVTELVPLYSRRPLSAGMPLTPVKTDLSLKFSFPLSLNRAGAAVTVETVLLESKFRLFGTAEGIYQYDAGWFEYTLGVGLLRQISLGQLTASRHMQGRWWTNVQLAGKAQVVGGLLVFDSLPAEFLYGAEVSLEISYLADGHWYFGVSTGYRYRTRRENGVFSSLQSNERGLTISPTFGWIW